MSTERLASIRAFLQTTGNDAFLLTAREDIRWACGFSGSSGALLITDTDATLFTDGRYADQAPSESRGVSVNIHSGDLITAVGKAQGASTLSSVAIDGANTSVAVFRRIQSWSSKPQIRSYDAPFAALIAVKSEAELRCIRDAQRITDAVFAEILSIAKPGMTEHELAAEIVYRQLKHGADGMSFDPIVASGPNGARPHARPTDRKFESGDLVVLDFGCFVDGYASDMTRTIGIGMPPPEAQRTYELVRYAQSAAQQAARSGMRACDLDGIARHIIGEAGLDDAFPHSLGHGIGLRIHEAPKLSSTNQESLPDGAVVTIEPGVYIAGQFGVRIENAVVLHPGGCEALPESSTELVII